MVVNFKVFKKSSPNGKIMLYLGKRDFVDHISGVEPIGMSVFVLIELMMELFFFHVRWYNCAGSGVH